MKRVFVQDGYMTIWGFSAYLSSFMVCGTVGWLLGEVAGRTDSLGAFIGVLVSLAIYHYFAEMAVRKPPPPRAECLRRIGVDV